MGELFRLDDGNMLPEPQNKIEAEIVEVDLQLGLRSTRADLEMARRLALIGRIINAPNSEPKSS